MTKQILDRIIPICIFALCALTGCGTDQDQANKDQRQGKPPANTEIFQQPLDWGLVDTVIVCDDRGPSEEKLYYRIKGGVIRDVETFIEEKTITSSKRLRIQVVGADILVFPVNKDGILGNYFILTYQGVKGYGGKRNHNLDALNSQYDKIRDLLEMVETKGEHISEQEAEEYIKNIKDINFLNASNERYWIP
jgi:hypothetical protein